MPRLDGFDVYEGNGPIDWPAVPSSVQFVALKASEGATHRDSRFEANWAGARSRNIRARFAYHFMTAAPADKQAHNLAGAIAAVGGLRAGEGVAVDVEVAKGVVGSLSVGFIRSVLTAIGDAVGRTPMLYIGQFYLTGRAVPLDQQALEAYMQLAEYPWWLPSYRSTPPAALRSYAAWQWGGALIPGLGPAARDADQVQDWAELDRICDTEEDDDVTPEQDQRLRNIEDRQAKIDEANYRIELTLRAITDHLGITPAP